MTTDGTPPDGRTAPFEVVIDDRIATVLATPVAVASAARIQYRQLLDLLGRMPPHFALPGAALGRLAELDRALPAAERAAILRGASTSLRHPALVHRLAAQEPQVAAAAIATARLDDWQWSTIIGELPLVARGYLRHRRDLGPRAAAMLARLGIGDLGLPQPAHCLPELELEEAWAEPSAGEGIGAIVKRIEAFRLRRQAGTRQFAPSAGSDAPRLPLADGDEAPAARQAAIRFASDAGGRIVWADAGSAAMPAGPMLAGMPFGSRDELATARCDAASARAIRQRRPVRGGRIVIAGAPAVAGAWRIDAAPRFDREGGRFIGYRGALRRPASEAAAAAEAAADRLRQLLHELRTPINAIQGFAELIQQQLFGPTPHQYRSLAASIAADSAAVLAGFDELERLVKLETGCGDDLSGRADFAALVRRTIAQLAPATRQRDVEFDFDAAGPAPVAMAESEAERMTWRLLATLAGAAAPGERLVLELSAHGEAIELAIALPAGLAAKTTDELFAALPAADGSPLALGLLGGGFALRLARAEARAVGGTLDLGGGSLRLRLPGLTPPADTNSPPNQNAAERLTGA